MFKRCREGISDKVCLDVKILVEETNFSLKMDTRELCTWSIYPNETNPVQYYMQNLITDLF